MINSYVAVFLLSVFIASCAQIILKTSADMEHASLIREYMNPRVIIGYLILFASTLITIIGYRGVELKMGPVLESSGYVFVLVLSHFFLHEKMSIKKILGIIFIVAGIVVFSV